MMSGMLPQPERVPGSCGAAGAAAAGGGGGTGAAGAGAGEDPGGEGGLDLAVLEVDADPHPGQVENLNHGESGRNDFPTDSVGDDRVEDFPLGPDNPALEGTPRTMSPEFRISMMLAGTFSTAKRPPPADAIDSRQMRSR